MGAFTGPNPTDRAKKGVKDHTLTDGNGLPLAVSVTGANRHDVTQLIPLVDAVPSVHGKIGLPHRRFTRVLADRGYDNDKYRRLLRSRNIQAGDRPARHRERFRPGQRALGRRAHYLPPTPAQTAARQCYERSDRMRLAFLKLRACQLCYLKLNSFETTSKGPYTDARQGPRQRAPSRLGRSVGRSSVFPNGLL